MDELETALRPLIAAIDAYLATLPEPGPAAIRAGIARYGDGPVELQGARRVPGTLSHLPDALSAIVAAGEPVLAELIGKAAHLLPWITYDLYPRQDIGEAFATSHCFVSLIGERALIEADDFDLGLFLIAPHTLYRDHHHAAPELYAPLTGPHGWRFLPGDPIVWKQAHQPVWNEAWRPHATLTGNVPFFAIFGWTADVLQPARVIAADDWAEIERLRPPG